ncbi:hypothetical protein ACVW1C_005781 [Bradyrhizobium sp. USDA 4011]
MDEIWIAVGARDPFRWHLKFHTEKQGWNVYVTGPRLYAKREASIGKERGGPCTGLLRRRSSRRVVFLSEAVTRFGALT